MNESYPARVVLADPRAAVRSALRLLVTDAMGMQVVGEIADAADLWPQMHAAQPEVLLLDWGMVATQASTLVPELHATWPGLRIIALSWRTELESAVLQAGADAFINKTDPPERLLQALQAVRNGDLASRLDPDEDGTARGTRGPSFPGTAAPPLIPRSTDPAKRIRDTGEGKADEPTNGASNRRKEPMI